MGDAVLCFVVSEYIYEENKTKKEGFLSKKRAAIVARKHLNMIGKKLIKKENLKINTKTISDNIYGNTLEALIGAIFIDRGFDYVRKFILNAWKSNIDKSGITILDPKTKLQEYSLKKFKKLPFYRLVNCSGPKHNPLYKISVSILESKPFIGTGKSKQEAEQSGAYKLLQNINIK